MEPLDARSNPGIDRHAVRGQTSRSSGVGHRFDEFDAGTRAASLDPSVEDRATERRGYPSHATRRRERMRRRPISGESGQPSWRSTTERVGVFRHADAVSEQVPFSRSAESTSRMDDRTFNESGEPTLLFVMGFGNRLDGASEGWLIDRLTDAGYRVHAIELSTDVTDFTEEYRVPVQRVHDEHEPAVVLSHSLGGLVTAFLDTTARTVYLSPWWGMYEAKVSSWERWLVPRLPLRSRVLPIKTRRDEIGEHLSDDGWRRLPKRISPRFITEVYRAQQARPPIDDDAVVFVSLEDTVVSLRAIGTTVSSDRIRLYDGGHQLFSARGRRAAVDEVVAVLPD